MSQDKASDEIDGDFRKVNGESLVDPETDLNDYSNAERFVDRVCQDASVRYVDGRGWYRWNGTIYMRADDWAIGEAAIVVRELFTIAAHIEDQKTRQAVLRHANSSLRSERLSAMVKLAAGIGGVKLAPCNCDRLPHLVGTQNGIVDMRAGVFDFEWEHSAEGEPFAADFITRQVATAFNSTAGYPRWQRFLGEVFADDIDLIDYVQRVVGYALSGHTSEHVLFFLHGSGANGKSVFVNILKELFGAYAAVISSETLLARKNATQTNDLARLQAIRLAIASDLDDGCRWNESLVKGLTGGDPYVARFLYGEFFEFTPIFKLFVVGNHRPIVRGTDIGIWRRIQLIPFNVFFPPDKRDRGLQNKLREELPGILRWAIAGYQAWLERGLAPPSCVVDATAAYRAEEDRVGQFLDERCEVNVQANVQSSVLYKGYHAWAVNRGETPLSMTRFGARLAERGIGRVKNSSVYFCGVALKDNDPDLFPPVPPVDG